MGTWIVGAVVLVLIGLAARKVYKDQKSGAGCGCGCDGCPKSGGGRERCSPPPSKLE